MNETFLEFCFTLETGPKVKRASVENVAATVVERVVLCMSLGQQSSKVMGQSVSCLSTCLIHQSFECASFVSPGFFAIFARNEFEVDVEKFRFLILNFS